MRMLQIHSDGFAYEAKKKALKNAEAVKEKFYKTEDSCLVNFIASETTDAKNVAAASKATADMIASSAEEVKEKNIVIYPWVHLTENPSKPGVALKLLKSVTKELKQRGFNVVRVPFGWYKAFEIHCKGHPLAERSKVLDISEVIAKDADVEVTEGEDLTALVAEEKTTSAFFIMEPGGKVTDIKDFNYAKYKELKLYVDYETAKDRTAKEPPPHIELMKQLELVDYEPGSDAGNFRWPPRGLTLKKAIEERVTAEMVDYGAHVLQTPLIYDYQHPSLKSYLQRFPSRQYVVKSGDHDYFARFSACFGQFLLISQATVSHKQLPLKLFEIAPSYRREQSGELAGMRRLRAFTMPDIHEIVADEDMAKEAVMRQIEFVEKLHIELEVSYEVSFRIFRAFYDENIDFMEKVVDRIGKPVLIEVYDEMYAYFIFKGEWNVVDAQKKAGCLGTVQIDVENGERFNITYVDEEGKEQHPLILHTSPSGAIERILYGVLEQAHKNKMIGKVPHLPLWMTPVQVRFAPVDDSFVEYCLELGKVLDAAGVRYEIDDRSQTVGKKVRSAEKLWVPYIAVIGEREQKSGDLSIRRRELKDQVQMTIEDLAKEIQDKTKFAPKQRLLFPKLVSEQAIFTRDV
ncbi:MAG: threonine--tRNA ligase [Candidatus Thorarchaeota archaeon]|nr:MAG: threonine--tRNA ligase [Candidatus Thorarchaeota archaeon]